jgi:hypothetical protein
MGAHPYIGTCTGLLNVQLWGMYNWSQFVALLWQCSWCSCVFDWVNALVDTCVEQYGWLDAWFEDGMSGGEPIWTGAGDTKGSLLVDYRLCSDTVHTVKMPVNLHTKTKNMVKSLKAPSCCTAVFVPTRAAEFRIKWMPCDGRCSDSLHTPGLIDVQFYSLWTAKASHQRLFMFIHTVMCRRPCGTAV